MSSCYIPQSVHTTDSIYEYRVGIFPLPIFPVEFSPSLVIRYLHFFKAFLFLYFSSDHSSCFLDGWFMYVPSHFPLILCLRHQYQYWTSMNIVLWFIDSPRFKIVKNLSITLVGVPSFHVGEIMASVSSSKLVLSAIILSSLVSVLVHSFAATMLVL